MAGIMNTVQDIILGPKSDEYCNKCGFKFSKKDMWEHKEQGWTCRKCMNKEA